MVQMESSSTAKRLWHIVRVVFYMLGKNIHMMDLHLLLKRGKIAGKALTNLLTFHQHSHHYRQHHRHHGVGSMYSAFSCRSMDPSLAFYSPKEVEFSCSNTPSSFHLIRRKHQHRRRDYDYGYDAAAVARAFEILNSEASGAESPPSAASPLPVHKLRIADPPVPEDAESLFDEDAEDFIRRFYEQLRHQQRNIPATPDHRREALVGRA